MKFNSAGRSNNESDVTRGTWSYQKDASTAKYVGVFENFNWYNNGWITDTDGNSCLRISNGAKFSVPIGAPYGSKTKTGVTFNSNV